MRCKMWDSWRSEAQKKSATQVEIYFKRNVFTLFGGKRSHTTQSCWRSCHFDHAKVYMH